MPASLPGDTLVNNLANPSAGVFVTFDPLSGPKGSPLDAKDIDYSTGTPAGWDATTRIPIKVANDEASGLSTGALSTGIGIGASVIGQTPDQATGPTSILRAGFDDNLVPGEEPTYAAPPPVGVVSANAVDSTRMYIGGGRSVMANPSLPDAAPIPGAAGADPYTAGIAICGAGQSASRDGGAGPAFTGFPLKMVTASGAVAAGAAIETGFTNRSGGAMVSGQSAFGADGTELAAAS